MGGHRAHRVVHRLVVTVGKEAGPGTDRGNAVTPGPQPRRQAAYRQIIKARRPRGWYEVARKSFPAALVMFAQQGEEFPLRMVVWGGAHICGKERPVPPADLVIREIANPQWVAPKRRDPLGRHTLEDRFQRGIERILPDELHGAAEIELRRARQADVARRE